jgi:uncharacterized protein (TIGR02147 family)
MKSAKPGVSKPNVFEYDDYRQFLADWISYLKVSGQKISPQRASKVAGLSQWHLGKIISGNRNLTQDVLEKLVPALMLTQEQTAFLFRLCELNDAKTADEGEVALQKARKFKEFSYKQLDSIKVHRYLAEWYYPVIREMAGLPDFKLDPKWIRDHLKYKVPISDIKFCLDFLIENQYLKIVDGRAEVSAEIINCSPGIHRLAMAKFHEAMLGLGVKSIYDTPRNKRKHTSHTIALSDDAIEKIRVLFDETLQKVEEIAKADKGSGSAQGPDPGPGQKEVYHVSLVAFPLSVKRGER